MVFLEIKIVFTFPNVSIPKERGVASNKSTSFASPPIIAPSIAAPIATTSSGLIDLLGSLPKRFLTASWMAGILV